MSTVLDIKLRNLEELERRAAMHGPGEAPLFLLNQIALLKEDLAGELDRSSPAAAHAVDARRRLAEARANLALIQVRESEYVQATDIPLQLIKEGCRWQAQIAELEAHLGAAGLPEAEIKSVPAMALRPDQVRAILERLERLQTGIDDLKRGQAAIYQELGAAQRRTVDELLAGLRGSSAALSELRGTLDAVRRSLIDLQGRQLPELDANVRRVLDQVSEVVYAETDLHTGLELTIPLIPMLLNYNLNLDLGGGLDLRQVWENLLAWMRRPKEGRHG